MRKAYQCWLIQPDSYTPKWANVEEYMTPNNPPVYEEDDIQNKDQNEEVEEKKKY